MMEIKKEILEQMINQSMTEVADSAFCMSEEFAIHEEFGLQVQVIITKESNDFFERIEPKYLAASE